MALLGGVFDEMPWFWERVRWRLGWVDGGVWGFDGDIEKLVSGINSTLLSALR